MCCVRTSMAQMAGQVTLEFVKEAGTNLIVTSAHTGARFTDKDEPSNHMSWQGRVFYITDADLEEFTTVKGTIESAGQNAGGSPNTGKYPDFRKTTGYGTGEGLDGYNCRHSFGPYDERIGNPWRDKDGNLIDGAGSRIDSEESKQKYKDSQRLRAIERNIRATKRQLVAKEQLMQGATEEERQRLQPEYDKIAHYLTQQNKKYNDFARKHNLRPQYGRTKLADFGREQDKAANAGAKRYKNGLSLDGNGGIIKTKNGIEVSTVSEHTIERAKERNVSRTDISNALENPLKIRDIVIDDNGRKSQRFIGENATVNINPDTGNVITVWKTGSGTKNKYRKSED